MAHWRSRGAPKAGLSLTWCVGCAPASWQRGAAARCALNPRARGQRPATEKERGTQGDSSARATRVGTCGAGEERRPAAPGAGLHPRPTRGGTAEWGARARGRGRGGKQQQPTGQRGHKLRAVRPGAPAGQCESPEPGGESWRRGEVAVGRAGPGALLFQSVPTWSAASGHRNGGDVTVMQALARPPSLGWLEKGGDRGVERPVLPRSRGHARPLCVPRALARAPPVAAGAGPGRAPRSLLPAPRRGGWSWLWTPRSPRCDPGSPLALGLATRMLEHRKTLLICLGFPLFLFPGVQAQNHAPPGCSPDLSPLYYNLCDRSGAWGIILEAVAGAGIITTFVLTIILVASLPFVQDTKKRSLLGTQVFFLLGNLGLFCLVFACVVKANFSTCASRRFLFGVLFAICFSCLVAHVLALNFLARKNQGPRGWVVFAVAILLTLVEVIINAEWLIITLLRVVGADDGHMGNHSLATGAGTPVASPCAIANVDFVMALIYVMLLLLAAFVGTWPALCGRFRRWRRHGVFVLLTTATSIAVWVVWIVMYTYGNRQRDSPAWDDPTLAIALATNAWAFVLFYVIPEVSQVTKASPEQSYQGDMYPTRGVGYETILKEQKGQMFVENKAFSMDEPASGKRPVSPYSGYNGQLLTSVYQPTEMALMHRGPSEGAYDVILPRATANSQALGSASSTLRAEDMYVVQGQQAGTTAPDSSSSQGQSPQNKTRW